MRFLCQLFRIAVAFPLALLVPVLRAQNTVTDATGVTLRTDPPARRVISLVPSVTEEIYSLGAGSRLVADTTFDLYPAAARSKPKIGSVLSPDLELIVALHPDLILASQEATRGATIQQLRRLHLPVFVMGRTASFAQIVECFRALARLLGRSEAADAVVHSAEALLAAVRAQAVGRAVPVFLELNGPDLVSVNRQTFLDEILRDAGGANVVAADPVLYPRLSREAVLRANPTVILIANEQADPQGEIQSWLRFPDLAAARSHRVFLVPSHVFAEPTPANFAAAAAITVKLLHPEAR